MAAFRHSARGFDLVQVVVVVALLGMLSAMTWSAFQSPIDASSREYLRQTLWSIDMELRSRASDADIVDVTVFLDDVLGVDSDPTGCPQGGLVPIPTAECACEAQPDPGACDPSTVQNPFRLDRDAAAGTITLERFGRCEQLELDPAARSQGQVSSCN